MCEMLAVASGEPVAIGEVLQRAMELERLGIAGFGWGISWLEDGGVSTYRQTGSLHDDQRGRKRLTHVSSVAFLLHLRRPSRLSTVGLADTQPFTQQDGAFAFCHNGVFQRHGEFRPVFQDRLRGKADSEVGFRLFESLLSQELTPEAALPGVHKLLGGHANMGYLDKEGNLLIYGEHEDNVVWWFKLGEMEMATTALHSGDLSVFDLIFPEASDRQRIDKVAHLGSRPEMTKIHVVSGPVSPA